jgi:hypothetical protein
MMTMAGIVFVASETDSRETVMMMTTMMMIMVLMSCLSYRAFSP